MAIHDSTTPSPTRRALLRLAALLAPAAAVPAAARAVEGSPPVAATTAPPDVLAPLQASAAAVPLAPPPLVRVVPGFDPDPIPVGTRCLWDGRDEVTIVAGPINPEPDVWDKPVGWYLMDGQWLRESHERMAAHARARIERNNNRIASLQPALLDEDFARRKRARQIMKKISEDSGRHRFLLHDYMPVAVNRRNLTIL